MELAVAGAAAEYTCQTSEGTPWPMIEIKDGICNGVRFWNPHVALCRDESSPSPAEQVEALGKAYSLSQNDCLDLTAGIYKGALAGAEYLNAATVCPQIGGLSNATGFCSVGPGGTFCDFLQSMTYAAQCDPADDTCSPNRPGGKMCCNGKREATGDMSMGLADIIWVTPGSEVSEYLKTTHWPHMWSPLCTGVDEAKFAAFREQLISSGACSTTEMSCSPIMIYHSIDEEALINAAMSGVVGVLFALAIVIIPCCYCCCGPLKRNLQERKVMLDYEQKVQRAVEEKSLATETEPFEREIHVPDMPEGRVGCTRSEKWIVGVCGVSAFVAVLMVAAIMVGIWSSLITHTANPANDILGIMFLLFCFASFSVAVYLQCGCCGGGGLRRQRVRAVPPVAVLVENDSVVHGRRVDDAQPCTRGVLERIFWPIHVVEDLERRPPRRPQGTSKVELQRGKAVVAGATYAAAVPSGLTYFRVPIGAKAGDLLYTNAQDDDGLIWGDKAFRHRAKLHTQQGRCAQLEVCADAFSETGKVAAKDVLNSSEWMQTDMSTLEGQLWRVRQIKRSGHPPMKVITASQLERSRRLPRSSEDLTEDLESLLQRHGQEGNKPSLVVVMFSHRWLRSDADEPHPDDEAGHKVRAMVQFAKWLKWIQAASERPKKKDVRGHLRKCLDDFDADVDTMLERVDLGLIAKNCHDRSNTLDKIQLPNKITDVAFWVDYACIDQDNPKPGIAALPMYVAACPVILCHETAGYEHRAWTRVERVLSFAYSGSAIALSIRSGFLHRVMRLTIVSITCYSKQMASIAFRTVDDPNSGSVTNEEDRAEIEELCKEAVLATEGRLSLGQTEVETRLLLADDDLEEISCWESYTRWRAKMFEGERAWGSVDTSEGLEMRRGSVDRSEGMEMRLL